MISSYFSYNQNISINTPMNYQYLLRKSLLLLRYPWTRDCNLGPFWGGWSYVGSAWCRFISVQPDVIIYWLNSTAVYGSTYLFFLKVALERKASGFSTWRGFYYLWHHYFSLVFLGGGDRYFLFMFRCNFLSLSFFLQFTFKFNRQLT